MTVHTGVISPAAEKPLPQVTYLDGDQGGLLPVEGSRLALNVPSREPSTKLPSGRNCGLSAPTAGQCHWRKPCHGARSSPDRDQWGVPMVGGVASLWTSFSLLVEALRS